MENEPTTKRKRIPGWIKTVVPLVISIAILYYYFRSQDWGTLYEAVAGAYVPLAVAGIAIPQAIVWYMFTYIAYCHLKWFHTAISFKDLFFIKGATYLLSLINNPLAGGGFFVYQLRKADITARKLGGITLFRMGLTMWGFMVYFAIATSASQYYSQNLSQHFNMYVVWGIIILNLLWMVEAWFFWFYDLKIGIGSLLVKKEDEFWSPWGMAEKKHWLLTWAAIVPSFITIFLGYYAVAISFGINVPFFKFMAMIPLVLMISNMPVAMGGFGTTTLAWVTFFPEYGTPDQLLAISLFIPSARLLVRVAMGVFSLPFALKDLSNLKPKAQT